MSKPPVHEIRLGYIKACIWQSLTTSGQRFNVTFSALYKKGDVWKESKHFSRDELLVLAKVADLAHTWIHNQAQLDAQSVDKESTIED